MTRGELNSLNELSKAESELNGKIIKYSLKANYNEENLNELKKKQSLNNRKYEEKKKIIMDFIMTVDDKQLQKALEYRYIDCEMWKDVAKKIGGKNSDVTVRKAVSRYLLSHIS